MPYKDRTKQLAYMKAYSKEKEKNHEEMRKAVQAGDYAEAKRISKRKITISLATVVA